MKDTKLTVDTSIFGNEIIQKVDFGGQAIRWVMDTRESDIRNALIKMGWSPPVQHKVEWPGSRQEDFNGNRQLIQIAAKDLKYVEKVLGGIRFDGMDQNPKGVRDLLCSATVKICRVAGVSYDD